MSLVLAESPGSFRHGDDVARLRERRGTTPLAHLRAPLEMGDDGPDRSVLLRRCLPRRFFRRLPGDGRIDAVRRF
jgi:hypothetical protein